MKTTVDIADNILERSRQLSSREHVRLRELVEEGLILVLERHEQRSKHGVKPVTFGGQGLSTEFRGRGWNDIRDTIYAERGS